jgi:hypothetical protein
VSAVPGAGLDDRVVRAGDRDRVGHRPVDRQRQHRLDAERRPALRECRVAGRLEDQPVEGEIVEDQPGPIAGSGSLVHRLELDLEDADVAREHAARPSRGEVVERRAHAVDVEHVLLAEAAHACAAEGLGLDQAQQREVAQRLAHGCLARAELLRDARLDERLPRSELAPDDASDQ